MSSIQNRYDFVLLFDVKDGNPNGDPDAGNLPRTDAETGQGLVTDVCLKRKIRNYIGLVKGERPPYEIYVKEKAVLNQQHQRAYTALGIEAKKKEGDGAKAWMCQNFFDIRAFGAVMTTGVNCGQVRGPIQFTFGRSIDRVDTPEHSITRMAVTTDKEAEKQGTFGRKFTVPYGLYRAHGFISAPLADQTGFSEEDLQLFWDSLKNMFEHDRSAARGEMTTCGLYVFQHESKLGNAPAHELFDRIQVNKKTELELPARRLADYEITIQDQNLPQGVKLQILMDARRSFALV